MIERESFDELINLQQLDLGGNQLDAIERGVFGTMGQLEFLWLNGNSLGELDLSRSWFASLIELVLYSDVPGNDVSSLILDDGSSRQTLRISEKRMLECDWRAGCAAGLEPVT
ncbi:MAG: leucine-rich repeat domain-containing protein [Pirellulaceae bacterium]|nr:hypothetical protein [Planctomycetales bacterium]